MIELEKRAARSGPSGLGCLGFNGQRMQTLVDEILERIIHKPMPGHGGFADKNPSRNAHPEMGTKAGAVGACVAMMLLAFVDHFKLAGLQDLLQALLQLGRGGGLVHGVGLWVSSATR